METIWDGLQISDILLIIGMALLINIMLMGLIYILFKMLFPLIKNENPGIKLKRVVRRDSQGSKPIRVRKMRLAQ